ncbi:hypothetical protein [Bacillus sp. Marseille-P3661]|uniref:hypothetical protein n=1 Tax=Bacillus sp. Marseille-P3661 TaxID=1936234 RepID=UPI000C83E9EF|nr:hypothetical protein [Bacillus sp. Marseille-P3661]
MRRFAAGIFSTLILILMVPMLVFAWDDTGQGIEVSIETGSIQGKLDKVISTVEVYRNGELLDRKELGEDYGYITTEEFNYSLPFDYYSGIGLYGNPFLPGDRIVLLNHNTSDAVVTKTPTIVYEFTVPKLTSTVTKNEDEGLTVINGETSPNKTIGIYTMEGYYDWALTGESVADSNGQFQFNLRPGLGTDESVKIQYDDSVGTIKVAYSIERSHPEHVEAAIHVPYGNDYRHIVNQSIPLKVRVLNNNNENELVTNVQWSVESEDGQPTTGASVDSSGTFAATAPGGYKVIAILSDYNNQKLENFIYINALGEPTEIYFYPVNNASTYSYSVGEPIEFDVDLRDEFSNRLLYNGGFHWEIEKYDKNLYYDDPRDPDHDKFIPSFDATMSVDRVFTASADGHYRITLTSDEYPDLPPAVYTVLVVGDLQAAKLETDKTIINVGESIDLDFGIYDSNYNELPLEYNDGYDLDNSKYQYDWVIGYRSTGYTHWGAPSDTYTYIDRPEGVIQFDKPGKYTIFFRVTKQVNYYATDTWGGLQSYVDIEVKDPALEQVKDIRITQVDYPEVKSPDYVENYASFKVEAIDENGDVVPGVDFTYEGSNWYDSVIEANGNVSVRIYGMWDGYFLKATVTDKPEITKTHYFSVFSPNYENIGSVELQRESDNGPDASTIYTRYDQIGFIEQSLQSYPLKMTVKDINGEVIPPGDYNSNYQGTTYLYAETLDGKPTENIQFVNSEFTASTLFYATKPGDYKIIAKSAENPEIQDEMVIHVIDRAQAIRSAAISIDDEQKPYTSDRLNFIGNAYDITGTEIPNEVFTWAVYNEDGSKADDVIAMEWDSPVSLDYYYKHSIDLVFPRPGQYKIVAKSTANPLIKTSYDILIESKPALAGVNYHLLDKSIEGYVSEGINDLTIKVIRDNVEIDSHAVTIDYGGHFYHYNWTNEPLPGDTIVLEYDNGSSDSFVIEDIQAIYDVKNHSIVGKTEPNRDVEVLVYVPDDTLTNKGTSTETGTFEIALDTTDQDTIFDYSVSTISEEGVTFTSRFYPVELQLDTYWRNLNGWLPEGVDSTVTITKSDGTVVVDQHLLDPSNYGNYLQVWELNDGDIVTVNIGDFYEESITVLTELPVYIDNTTKTISGFIPGDYDMTLSIGWQPYEVAVDELGFFNFSFEGLTDYNGFPINSLTINDFDIYLGNSLIEMMVEPIEGNVEPPPLEGDYDHNDDGVVDATDLKMVIVEYGSNSATSSTDIDSNGTVDIYDVVLQAIQLGYSPISGVSSGSGGGSSPTNSDTTYESSSTIEEHDGETIIIETYSPRSRLEDRNERRIPREEQSTDVQEEPDSITDQEQSEVTEEESGETTAEMSEITEEEQSSESTVKQSNMTEEQSNEPAPEQTEVTEEQSIPEQSDAAVVAEQSAEPTQEHGDVVEE